LIHSADSEYIQGLQFYTSMKELHKPVELIIYADEGHIMTNPSTDTKYISVMWIGSTLVHDKKTHDQPKANNTRVGEK